ncbi:MAG: hypothetical protein IPJ85_03535 [Flavobacteriales bacterium]|nr:hypothetical protein [Flavobacteriales bacterium]
MLSSGTESPRANPEVTVGAARTDKYVPLLSGQRVAVVTNHSARIGNSHLVDSLVAHKADVQEFSRRSMVSEAMPTRALT